MFDKNGDGVFDMTEFEAMFTVLEIGFKLADLRLLVRLTDKNKDGKIDSKEFTDMLQDVQAFEVVASESDYDL